jgi:hypothetical protein
LEIFPLGNLKKLIQVVLFLSSLNSVLAHSYVISDLGSDTNAYWGGNAHGYGDVIGDSTYDIRGAEVTLNNGILNIKIWTNFAGHAGEDAWAGPNGIGYGDVFLAPFWNPFGSDAHNVNDNASNGTRWAYGLSLDDRWSNVGGTFKLYELAGSSNLDNVLLSNDFLTCGLGTECYYRDGQATAVNTASASVIDTGLVGNWTVTPGSVLEFSLNSNGTALANYDDLAFHWGQTCQNDVIEGFGMDVAFVGANETVVPEPPTFALLVFGLFGLVVCRLQRGPKAAIYATRLSGLPD